MKNILFLISSLNHGGAERVIVTLANNWCKKYNVSILTLRDAPSFYKLNNLVKHEKMNVYVSNTKLKRLFLLPYIEFKRIKCFINYIKNNKQELIIAFGDTSCLLACFSKVLANIKCPIILSERNDPKKLNNFFIRSVISILYRLSSGIICQNEYSKNYFIKQGFKIPISVLPNPVNFQDIPTEIETNKQREIVTVGRLALQKNQLLLIHAFKEITKEYPEYILKIYGEGPLKNMLKKEIIDLKLQDRIFLMGTKKRVMFDVQQSDFFVLTSNFEGFPNVLIEAMACGMPVISSDFPTGIAHQLIKDGENGFLFSVGKKEELIQAIKKMFDYKNKWAQMGRKNREIAKTYEAEKVAQNWLSTINSMLLENK